MIKISMSKKKSATEKAFPIIGIGASAGGLEAITKILKKLPDRINMAIVIIQHYDPKHETLAVNIFSKLTKIKISEAKK